MAYDKYYLIHCLCHAFSNSEKLEKILFLFLAPTGITDFNINGKTVHASLKIPIKDMKPLQQRPVSLFQEQMRHIRYILIDEMSFIHPKFFMQINSRLWEVFLENKTYPFGGRSIILVGDLGQFSLVKDKSIKCR